MSVKVTPRTIPGGDRGQVRVLTQASQPGRVLVSLSIQEEAIGTDGIIRDHGPPFVIKQTKRGPVRVEAAGKPRGDFLPALGPRDSHLARFEKTRSDREPVAVTGCGNLLCNAGVEARTQGRRAGIRGSLRAGIMVQPDGRGRLVEGSRLEEALSADLGAIGRSPDQFVITGPLLVAGGKAVEPDVREFADLRHLILPGYVKVPGRQIDFGFDWLGKSPELARRAAAGSPVTLPLVAILPVGTKVDSGLRLAAVEPRSLRAALKRKGYREVPRVTKPGTFRIGENEVEIAFLPGIYPHHALAVDDSGVVTSVIVTGRSNREGTTVRDFATALAKAGMRDAILLDNGGDVGLLRRPSAVRAASKRKPAKAGGPKAGGPKAGGPRAGSPKVGGPKAGSPRAGGPRLEFEVRPAEADRARAWPLRACLIFHEPKPGSVRS